MAVPCFRDAYMKPDGSETVLARRGNARKVGLHLSTDAGRDAYVRHMR
jgi:hypothetical protein